MIWVGIGGILAVAVAAVVVAARHGGRGWWRFLLGGAAGWLAAQVVKGVLVTPLTLTHAGAALPTQWWFVGLGALLPGVVEELGKYLPLRWLRADARGAALALGLGAGAIEALTLIAGFFAPGAAAHQTLAGSLLAVWERFWAVGLHGAEAVLDGLAVVRRSARWLLLAMGVHTLTDLGAAWYQHATAVGARGAARDVPLLLTEVLLAVAALVVWWLGRRLWARAASGGR